MLARLLDPLFHVAVIIQPVQHPPGSKQVNSVFFVAAAAAVACAHAAAIRCVAHVVDELAAVFVTMQ